MKRQKGQDKATQVHITKDSQSQKKPLKGHLNPHKVQGHARQIRQVNTMIAHCSHWAFMNLIFT